MTPTMEPRTVGRTLLVVVLLALLAPFVVYAVPATVGGEASYVVLTASMTPAIAPGDVVIVDDVPPGAVAVGDVIVFQRSPGDQVPVTHRVVDVERTADGTPVFRTKGDANEDADLRSVTPDRLVGRVALTVPLVGYVVQFVGTPVGFVALVVVPLGLLVATEALDLLHSARPGGDAGTGDDPDDGHGGDAPDDQPPSAATGASLAGQTDPLMVTPVDLTVSSAILGGFTLYAAYAALQRPTAVPVAVAVAVGATFAVVLGAVTYAWPAPRESTDVDAQTGADAPTADVVEPADADGAEPSLATTTGGGNR